VFRAGESLDFVVDIGDGLNSDQFLWSMRVQREADAGIDGGAAAEVWDAEKDFASQPQSKMDAWVQFVQVLMLTNEFMFVD
jgi:hypothetical protein